MPSFISGFLDEKIQQNYLEASIDSMWLDTTQNIHYALFYQGPKYSFENVILDSLDQTLLKKNSVGKITGAQDYMLFRKSFIQYYADNGYPFAKIYLNQASQKQAEISGTLKLDKGRFIIVDSLILNGPIKLSKNFLEKYLDIKEGNPYQHSRISRVSQNLDQLAFLDQIQPPQVTFFGNYATIDLFLQEKSTSRFDLLFGVIPTNNFQDRSLFLSLDMTAELYNKLGYGEYLFVDFERLRPEQQRFEFQFNYPYIFKWDYGLDIDFNIFRLSLDYQTLLSDVGIEYIINNRNRLKLSWNYESSNIVELDTTQMLQTGQLPQDLDIDQNGLSVELRLNNLDHPVNPLSGRSLDFKATLGLREIKRNADIIQLKNQEFDFESAYDSLQLRSSRIELKTSFRNFIPIGKRNTLASIFNAGWRYSSQRLFRNEKFQIGGNQLLRGFDEAQFFTSYYTVLSLENRLLLSENSFLNLPFVDLAMLENNQNDPSFAIGIGGGISIETKAGLFSFSIAVGRTENIDFDLQRPKAHLGFISLF